MAWRGAHLLRNETYLGLIRHKGKLHPAQYPPIAEIIDEKTFERVQLRPDHAADRWKSERNPVVRAPLAGRIFDAAGELLSPSFKHGKRGQLFHYYVISSLQKGAAPSRKASLIRHVPGSAIGDQLTQNLQRLVPDAESSLALPRRIEVHPRIMHVLLEETAMES